MNRMTENEFLSAIRLHLDKSIAQLDADIGLRLDSMREQALNPSKKVVVDLGELRATDKLVQTIRTNLEHSASVYIHRWQPCGNNFAFSLIPSKCQCLPD